MGALAEALSPQLHVGQWYIPKIMVWPVLGGQAICPQNSAPVSNIYRCSRDMCLFIELASCQVLFKALASKLISRHDKGLLPRKDEARPGNKSQLQIAETVV